MSALPEEPNSNAWGLPEGAWEVAAASYMPPWLAISDTGPDAGRGGLLRSLLAEGWERFAVTPGLNPDTTGHVWLRRRVQA